MKSVKIKQRLSADKARATGDPGMLYDELNFGASSTRETDGTGEERIGEEDTTTTVLVRFNRRPGVQSF